MKHTMKRALIVGATSSLARILARKLAGQGVDLVLAGRDMGELKRLQTDLAIRTPVAVEIKELDLLDASADLSAFAKNCGPLDAAFMLAGLMGNDNATTHDNIEQVVQASFLQSAKLLSSLADNMEEQGGVIAVVSSVAGDRGRASNFVYGSAKAGLTAFADGLRAKLFQAKSKVHVLTVKPGFIDTPLTFAADSGLTASREQVVEDILRAMKKRKNSIYTPRIWWCIMFIIAHIPGFIFKRLKF